MRTLPAPLASADPPLVRPRDLDGVYAQPPKELRDLAHQGALLRVAHGYYAVVPEPVRHLGGWTPTAEAVALALARRDYGTDAVALMGMSAARMLGAVPRALGTAVVAVPKQRPPLTTAAGRIVFVLRDVDTLDTERVETELGDGWVTTVDQTVLDLADRPRLGGFPAGDVGEARRALTRRADPDRVGRIADRQRKRAAAARALQLGETT